MSIGSSVQQGRRHRTSVTRSEVYCHASLKISRENFEFLDVKNKEKTTIPFVTFKPQQFLGDGGWSSGWQRQPVCCTKSNSQYLSNSPLLSAIDHPTRAPSLGDDLRDRVGTTGDSLVATATFPDTNSLALDGVLSAEGADVAGVLLDFHLLHLLTQGGTVSVIEHIVSTITPR